MKFDKITGRGGDMCYRFGVVDKENKQDQAEGFQGNHVGTQRKRDGSCRIYVCGVM